MNKRDTFKKAERKSYDSVYDVLNIINLNEW